MTISSKDGLIAQEHFFNKLVSSKDLSGYYLLKKGEFAYNKSYSVGYDFGSIKRLELYEKGALSTLYICFSVKYFRPEYIRYYFDSLKWYKEIYLIAAEGARNHGLLNVPTESFFETKHLLSTNLMEQAKIANFLSLIDQRIEKQRQLVESLKKYKRGLFNKCFSKLNDYKYLKLGSFAKIYQPSTISQNEFTNGPYKVFGANGYIGNYDKYNHALPQVTVSCRGEKCGTVNFVDAYTWITGNSMVINIDECNILNKKFLYHCLSNQNLRYLISGSAQPQIVRNAIELHKIPCPNLVEQNKIATFLDQNENLIIREECKLSNLISYKRGLLQQMFI